MHQHGKIDDFYVALEEMSPLDILKEAKKMHLASHLMMFDLEREHNKIHQVAENQDDSVVTRGLSHNKGTSVEATSFDPDLFANLPEATMSFTEYNYPLVQPTDAQNTLMTIFYIAAAHYIPPLISEVLGSNRGTAVARRLLRKWVSSIVSFSCAPKWSSNTHNDDAALYGVIPNTSQEDACHMQLQKQLHERVATLHQGLEENALEECGNDESNSPCLEQNVQTAIKLLVRKLLADPQISQGVQITLCPSVWYASLPIIADIFRNNDTDLCVESLKQAFNATELTGHYYEKVMKKIDHVHSEMTAQVSPSPERVVELEDELLQWQIVSIMYSVSADHGAAAAVETVSSSVMYNAIADKSHYIIDTNFVYLLRKCKSHLQKNNVPASRIPGMCWEIAMQKVQDRHVLQLLQRFRSTSMNLPGGIFRAYMAHTTANGSDTYYEQMHLAVRLLLQATQEKSELMRFFDNTNPESKLFNMYLRYFKGEFPAQANTLYADFASTMSWIGSFTGASKPVAARQTTIDQTMSGLGTYMDQISHFLRLVALCEDASNCTGILQWKPSGPASPLYLPSAPTHASEPAASEPPAYVSARPITSAEELSQRTTEQVFQPYRLREDAPATVSPGVVADGEPVAAPPSLRSGNTELEDIERTTATWYEQHPHAADSFPANIVSGGSAATHVLLLAMLASVMLGCKGVQFTWQTLLHMKKETQQLRQKLVKNAGDLLQAHEKLVRMRQIQIWVATSNRILRFEVSKYRQNAAVLTAEHDRRTAELQLSKANAVFLQTQADLLQAQVEDMRAEVAQSQHELQLHQVTASSTTAAHLVAMQDARTQQQEEVHRLRTITEGLESENQRLQELNTTAAADARARNSILIQQHLDEIAILQSQGGVDAHHAQSAAQFASQNRLLEAHCQLQRDEITRLESMAEDAQEHARTQNANYAELVAEMVVYEERGGRLEAQNSLLEQDCVRHLAEIARVQEDMENVVQTLRSDTSAEIQTHRDQIAILEQQHASDVENARRMQAQLSANHVDATLQVENAALEAQILVHSELIELLESEMLAAEQAVHSAGWAQIAIQRDSIARLETEREMAADLARQQQDQYATAMHDATVARDAAEAQIATQREENARRVAAMVALVTAQGATHDVSTTQYQTRIQDLQAQVRSVRENGRQQRREITQLQIDATAAANLASRQRNQYDAGIRASTAAREAAEARISTQMAEIARLEAASAILTVNAGVADNETMTRYQTEIQVLRAQCAHDAQNAMQQRDNIAHLETERASAANVARQQRDEYAAALRDATMAQQQADARIAAQAAEITRIQTESAASAASAGVERNNVMAQHNNLMAQHQDVVQHLHARVRRVRQIGDNMREIHAAELARLQEAHLAAVIAAGEAPLATDAADVAAVHAARITILENVCQAQLARIARQEQHQINLEANIVAATEEHAVALRAHETRAGEALILAARHASEQAVQQQLEFDTHMATVLQQNVDHVDTQTQRHEQELAENAQRMQMQQDALVRDGTLREQQHVLTDANRILAESLLRNTLGVMLREPLHPSNVIGGINLQFCLQSMTRQPRTIPAILTSNFFFTQPGSQHFVTEATRQDVQTLYYSMTHVLEVLLEGAFAARARVRQALPADTILQLDLHFANLWILLSLEVQPVEMMCTDPDNRLQYGEQWTNFREEIAENFRRPDTGLYNRNSMNCMYFILTSLARYQLPSDTDYITLASRFETSTPSKKRNALIIMQRILCLILGKVLPGM